MPSAEHARLRETREGIAWKRWGPYLSERQWGTVREDYSDNGDAWGYFTHDQARSRAYRWGEDGIAGICDDKQQLCFALALWNGRDPILKERLFGVTNAEGNHCEDVKEYYFYLDATPTSSYLRYLYKYPQAEYPYADLVATNRARTRTEPEYELLDTGVFDDDRYFDVVVEVAKGGPDDLLVRIEAHNRGPESATIHLLPTLWYRNTWSWGGDETTKPVLRRVDATADAPAAVAAEHARLGTRHLYVEGRPRLLFTENETNRERLWGEPNPQPYVKDAFHEAVVHGVEDAVNPEGLGTKCAAHHELEVPAGGSVVVRLRLVDRWPDEWSDDPVGDELERIMARRRAEADDFYDAITPPSADEDGRLIIRQALAGMLWSKQYDLFDVATWLEEHGAEPLASFRGPDVRNREWFHMINDDVISMPDKWEYPWYAAWDLAFHTLALDLVDHDFALQQLDLMLSELYLHPNGQIPAYEWNFGDVNPPVHAWATLFLYRSGRGQGAPAHADLQFLKDAFQKLLVNYTWWVNRKDPEGRHVFEGGFLGLDNIGVFDRSKPLPTGGHLEQADGTAWMALYTQNMLEIAIELALHDPTYEDMVLRFLAQFVRIAAAMDRVGVHDDEMWDEEDGFFYDVLRLPDGSATRLKVRSYVGLLPLCAVTVLSGDLVGRFPRVAEQLRRMLERHGDVLANITDPRVPGVQGRRLLAVIDEGKLRRILARMLDEDRFLSPYGVRSLSKWHEREPYVFEVHGERYEVGYLPAESDSGLFGGNSNWRGPVWFPVNVLIIRALLQLYTYFGDDLRVECPTGSGREMNLFEVAQDIGSRLTAIFRRDEHGRRPVFGGAERFQTDPHWRDHLLFYEYFQGDDGAGLGASHQTGWTGTVARVTHLLAVLTPEVLREEGIAPLTVHYLLSTEG